MAGIGAGCQCHADAATRAVVNTLKVIGNSVTLSY